MLTPGQVAHFETFGFVILRHVFDAAEVSIIRRDGGRDLRGGQERRADN